MDFLNTWLHENLEKDMSDIAKNVLIHLRNEWDIKTCLYNDIEDQNNDLQSAEECTSYNDRLLLKATNGRSSSPEDFNTSNGKISPINGLSPNMPAREEQSTENFMLCEMMNNGQESNSQTEELSSQKTEIDCLSYQTHVFKNKDMILSGNITQEEMQEADDILADCSHIFYDTENNSDMEYLEQGEILTSTNTKKNETFLKSNQVYKYAKQINAEENEKHVYDQSSSYTFVRHHNPESGFESQSIENDNSSSNKVSQMSESANNFEIKFNINNNINDDNVKVNNLSTDSNNKKSNCCFGTPANTHFQVLNKKSNTIRKVKVNTIHGTNLKVKVNSLKYYFPVKPKVDCGVKKQFKKEPQNMKKANLPKQMNIKTMLLKANKKLDETSVLFTTINNKLIATSDQINEKQQSYMRNRINETPLTQSTLLFPEQKPRNYNVKKDNAIPYILDLSEEILKFEDKLMNMQISEILLTLTYRQGFCDLNKVDTGFVSDPSGLVIGICEEDQRRSFYFLSLEKSKCLNFDKTKKLLFILFTSSYKIVCYCAQNVVKQIMKTFSFQGKEVALRWNFFDPMIGSWLMNPDNPIKSFYQITEDFGIKIPHKIKKSKITEDCSEQTCKLLMILSDVAKLMFQKLSDRSLWKLFNELETKLVPILAVMELQGMCINIQQLKGIGNIMKEQIERIENMAYKTVGKKFQISSTCQLRNILYGELKLDEKHGVEIQTTATNGFKSTSESMLRRLEMVHPLPGLVLEYRHLQKIKSTYVDGILQHISGGLIYTSWNQVSAATGRITSKNPNLQSIPKKPVLLKTVGNTKLLPRLPFHSHVGYTLVAADFKHIELRLLANFSKDSLLIAAFQKPGDIFVHLSTVWLDKSEDTVGPEDREQTKKIVYSVMYGIGASKLSEYLHVTTSEAEKIINKFLACFPAIKKFSQSIIKQCREKGFLSTVGGRQRIFPNINSLNQNLRAYSERQAINFIIQGSAADVCKWAIIQTSEELAKYTNIDVKLLLQIHDELVWEVNDDHVVETIGIINKVLNENKTICGYEFPVCLPVLITSGKNWSDMNNV